MNFKILVLMLRSPDLIFCEIYVWLKYDPTYVFHGANHAPVEFHFYVARASLSSEVLLF